MKQADPYTMNQERHNPPAEKYHTGDPSAWAEDQNMAHPWESEGRTETGHPAPARQAVVQARQLEDKALKCITIAQRMLPGADDTIVEDQATDFMFMPERAIMATLQRQAELATKIAEDCDEDDKKKKDAPAEEKPVDAKKEEKVPAEEVTEEPKEAKKEEKVPAEEVTEEPKEAKKEEKVPAEEVIEEPKEAKKEEKVPAEEVTEEPKEASKDLLDVLFDNAEIPQEPKTGAKKLSGLVKQAASTGDASLAGLWETPPDISAVFGKTR
jgi:hypothetical protein